MSFSAILLICSGCSKTVSPQAFENIRENVHPNGLIIKLSENFIARQTANGFIIEPSGDADRNLRVPIEIKVDFNRNKDLPADLKFQEKTVENRKIVYRIDKSEGGSGGEMYEFTGFEQVTGGVIEYRQTTQSKELEPDFSHLWQLIENTTLKK